MGPFCLSHDGVFWQQTKVELLQSVTEFRVGQQKDFPAGVGQNAVEERSMLVSALLTCSVTLA